MRLDQLLGDADVVRGAQVALAGASPADVEVTGVTHRSRDVVAGTVYCCLRGATYDGHGFAAEAARKGGVLLVCEHAMDLDVAQLVVADARAVMATVAAAFHGHPSRRLRVVAITGTNGKTTTAALLGAILSAGGLPAEVVGTLGAGHASDLVGPSVSTGAIGCGPGTTPESSHLQAELAAMVRRGTAAVALEVSSHALVQHRVDAMSFAAAVFTNLSPEHLDYHATMDDYFEAKARLFAPERAAVAVINADDPWGRRLLAAVKIPTRTFRLSDAVGLRTGATSSSFRWQGVEVRVALAGPANVANALAAAAAAAELGIDADAVAAGLASVRRVPGRLEAVASSAPFAVTVDYAHTPAALEATLGAARSMADGGRVLVVFGCGGGRDRSKRPAMGEVATRLADVAVLTSDNPRHERPEAIIDEVRAGVVHPERLVVEPDRRCAIAVAVAAADPGDVVIIAGKGHESTQIMGDTVSDFDDRVVAAEELGRIGW